MNFNRANNHTKVNTYKPAANQQVLRNPCIQKVRAVVLLVACMALANLSLAQGDNETPPQDSTTQQQASISAKQAANIAKQAYAGKVLRVHAVADGYRIKMLLPSGKVTYVNVGPAGQLSQ